MTGTKISLSTSGSSGGQKAPIFSIKKAGFVIPKNKLAGSLVPVLRGAKKPGLSDAFGGGEASKRVVRKTKWGLDLTQDPAVRKARALAYQTRVDQITQLLKSGMSEVGDTGDAELASQSPEHESYGREIDTERSEQLELEKREAIGEILKLNPSYKAPPDYKPVLKEDQVSIPVKQYPGYNFVGLIFGPGGDNQKHLEKETGAKIKMFGTKADSGNKIEIKQLDSNDVHDAYEEIHIHISADIFDKVDAAISVIELLIASVSENLASASTTSTLTVAHEACVASGPDVTTTLDPDRSSMMQPTPGPTQTLPQGQLGYPSNPWFPMGPPNTALGPPPPISSALAHVPNLPFNAPSNTPSPVGFNLNPQNPYPFPNISAPSMGLTRPLMQPLPQPGPIIQVSTGFGNSTQMAPRMALNHGPYPASNPVTPSNMLTPTLINASPMGPTTSMLVSGSIANFNSQNPQSVIPPSSGNFPFQALSSQNAVSQMVPRPHSNQLGTRNAMPTNPMLQSQSPRPPSSQLPGPNFAPQSFNHGFPRPPMGNNMGPQPQPHISLAPVPFVRNSSRLPSHYGPASQVPVFPGHRPGPHAQIPQHNSHLSFASGRPLSTPGEQQLYDPFSPTSMSGIRRR